MLIWMVRSGHLSTASRKQLAGELAGSLPGCELETRRRMIGVIQELNVKSGIEPLRAALKKERDESVRAYIDHAIRCLEACNPSLPM
jgi:hypothetical protein